MARRSHRATFPRLLLTALVPGLASLPPPSLPTGWTRFGAELEDRAPGAALRLLRRRMRPPPPLGLPPSGAARGTQDPAGMGRHILKSEELGDVPSPFHHTHYAPAERCFLYSLITAGLRQTRWVGGNLRPKVKGNLH